MNILFKKVNMKISIFFSFILINIINGNKISEPFLDWGLKNNFELSSLVEASLSEKKQLKFIAKEDIPKEKELLTIPNSLTFNITKLLELIGSKSLKKQYKEFQKLKLSYGKNPNDSRKEEAFIAYIIYLIVHKPKKYKKTKFYEFYENYLESLKKYSVRSPLFYDENQIEYLAGTFLSKTIDIFQKIYEDEIKIFSNESYYKKELDYDEFVHYRLVVHNKGLNITNHCTLVPFLNIIESDLTLYNSYHIIKENGDIKIISKKDIKKGDEIILNSYNKPNPLRLVLEGKTEEKLVNYFEEFWISAFSPGLYYQYGIQDIDFFRNYDINLLDKDFVSKCIKLYSDNAEYLNGDGSEIWSYNVLESNLYFYKEHFDTITKTKIYEIFYNKDDRINIERIVRGEKKMIEDKLAQVSKILDVIIEEDRKNKKKRMEENKFENNEYNDNKENDEPDL